jgi:hydrogenase maturation factor
VLKVPSQISKIETTSDGGMKLTVHTQELEQEDKAELMNLHNKIGYFVFSVTGIKEEDIPDEPIEFEGQKTLSERLRNVLFRLHEKQNGKPEDFEAYRQKVMEKLINHYKQKLDE